MIGEIRQNFTEASASVGLILATALKSINFVVYNTIPSSCLLDELSTECVRVLKKTYTDIVLV